MTGDGGDRRMLGALLSAPSRAIIDRIARDLPAAGFSDVRPAHFAVFRFIEPTGSRLTELADRAQITKQSMGYLVDYLETRGYVERVPDPKDGRARLIRLTARGWETDRAARTIMACIETEWADRVGAERLEQLKQTLRDLADSPER